MLIIMLIVLALFFILLKAKILNFKTIAVLSIIILGSWIFFRLAQPEFLQIGIMILCCSYVLASICCIGSKALFFLISRMRYNEREFVILCLLMMYVITKTFNFELFSLCIDIFIFLSIIYAVVYFASHIIINAVNRISKKNYKKYLHDLIFVIIIFFNIFVLRIVCC